MPTSKKTKYQYTKEWRKKNPQKQKEYAALYGVRHRKENNERLKRWQRENRDKTSLYFKNWKDKNYEAFTRYSLRKKTKTLGVLFSFDDYIALLKRQGGCCAICKNPETAKHKSGSVCLLSIDHSHSTNKVRGLLCKKCNTAIGFLLDNSAVAFRAYKYLKGHEK